MARKPIRLTIANDQQFVVDGTQLLIDTQPDIEIVAIARDAREVAPCLQKHPADMLLLDYCIPGNDLHLINELKAHYRDVKIIVMTGHRCRQLLLQIARSSADALFEKHLDSSQLLTTIRHLHRGKEIPPPINQNEKATLSKREFLILHLIAEGYSNTQIAERLHRSIKTVDAHRQNLMKKLEARSVAELVRTAMRAGLIE